MFNLHPPMTGFPLAGAGFLVALECVGLWNKARPLVKVTRPLIILGCIVGTCGAFFSGYQASSEAGELSASVQAGLASHHAWGRFLLLSSVLMGVFFFVAQRALHGRRLMMAMYYCALATFVILTLLVGQLGGELVFVHGVGVVHPTTP